MKLNMVIAVSLLASVLSSQLYAQGNNSINDGTTVDSSQEQQAETVTKNENVSPESETDEWVDEENSPNSESSSNPAPSPASVPAATESSTSAPVSSPPVQALEKVIEKTTVQKPAVTPVQKPVAAPAQKPAIAPIQKPAVAPIQKPAEAPAQKQVAAPLQKPAIIPQQKPLAPVVPVSTRLAPAPATDAIKQKPLRRKAPTAAEISLTQTQTDSITAIRRASNPDLEKKLEAELKQVKAEMNVMMGDATPAAKVREKFELVQKKTLDLQKLKFERSIRIRDVLTVDQRKKLNDFRNSH